MAVQAQTLPKFWRRCEVTGLTIDRTAERVFMVNAVTAVLFLGAGGIMALLIALTRWEAVRLLDADWYYRLVSAHGASMLIFWILFFEVAGLAFGGAILLNVRMVAPRLAWIYYGMMLIGALMVEFTMLTGRATVMITAYPPLRAESSWFYLGMILVAVGALLALIHFIANVVNARLSGQIATLPLFSFALLAAAIIGIWTLLSGAATFVPLLALVARRRLGRRPGRLPAALLGLWTWRPAGQSGGHDRRLVCPGDHHDRRAAAQ